MWIEIRLKRFNREEELLFLPGFVYARVGDIYVNKSCLEINCIPVEVLSESGDLGNFILHSVYANSKSCGITGTWENDDLHGDYPCVAGFELLGELEVLQRLPKTRQAFNK